MYKIYLKKHNVTGLKYIGYTKKEDVQSYVGSGVYWLRHIKKHGYDVKTEILGEYKTQEELKEAGIKFSEELDIINDTNFANLKTEEGISGRYDESVRKVMSEKAKRRGAPKTAWTSEQVSELNKKTWQDPEVRKKRAEGISKALRGRKNGPRSEEFKKLMKEKLTGRSYGKGIKHNLVEKECPHCGKKGKGPNMTRYHFDKCRGMQ